LTDLSLVTKIMMFEDSSDSHYLVVAGDSSSHGHNIQRLLLLHSSFAADQDAHHRHHSIGGRKVAGCLHSCLQHRMEEAQRSKNKDCEVHLHHHLGKGDRMQIKWAEMLDQMNHRTKDRRRDAPLNVMTLATTIMTAAAIFRVPQKRSLIIIYIINLYYF